MLSPVSTWMGDRLGTLGAVGINFFLSQNFTLVTILVVKHPLGDAQKKVKISRACTTPVHDAVIGTQ